MIPSNPEGSLNKRAPLNLSTRCIGACQAISTFFSNIFKVKTPTSLLSKENDINSVEMLTQFTAKIPQTGNAGDFLKNRQVEHERQLFLEYLQNYLNQKKTFTHPLSLNISRLEAQKEDLEELMIRYLEKNVHTALIACLELCRTQQDPSAIASYLSYFLSMTAGSQKLSDWNSFNQVFGDFSRIVSRTNTVLCKKIEDQKRDLSIQSSLRKSAEVFRRLSHADPTNDVFHATVEL